MPAAASPQHAAMSCTRNNLDSPWPTQTPTPIPTPPSPSSSTAHGRANKRRRRDLYPNRPLRRQVITDQGLVDEAKTRCQLLSGNDVISCYPIADTVIPQHEWASFVWNSRRPEITQTNQVDIYLFRADSQEMILHERNVVNPFGSAGVFNAQVNDSWFGVEGSSWSTRAGNVSYPFYWVISRSDRPLDGSQRSQSIFSAIQTTFADSVVSSRSAASASSASLASSLASLSAASSTLTLVPTPSASSGSVQNASSDSGFPRWAIAVITVLGFLAIASLGILAFFIIRRVRRKNQEEIESNRNSMNSSSPMITNAGQQGSPLLGSTSLPPQPNSPVGTGSVGVFVGGGGGAMSERDRNAPSVVMHDGASTTSAGDGPFSGADAAIMADAFRKMLRKPDFAGRPVEEGDSPEGIHDDDDDDDGHHVGPGGAGILGRELAEEGRDIRSVSSERGVRVETGTVESDGGSTVLGQRREIH